MKYLHMRNCFLIVQGEYDSLALPCPLTCDNVKVFVQRCLRDMFGEVAASSPFEILKVDEDKQQFIIKVPSDQYVKLHAALTMTDTISIMGQHIPALFSVLQPVTRTLGMLAGVMRSVH